MPVALFWLAASILAAEPSSEHRAPAETLAPAGKAVEAGSRNTLAEMKLRRIISPDSERWTAEDMKLIESMRAAERRDAVAVLRRRAGRVAGLTVLFKPAGAMFSSLRLTREGFEMWLSLLSQDAIDYFEQKGVDAKWAFKLLSLEGRPLFDGAGHLTSAGQEVYDQAIVNRPAWWKTPAGEVFGTRPPPKPDAPSTRH